MRSSTGQHFIALDQVRALAAFLVFSWHFMQGLPAVDQEHYSPLIFPFALIDEGHTGVALFMTLSGYLFAKLLSGQRIRYGAFLYNRAVRLLPLLILVLLVRGGLTALQGQDIGAYVERVVYGVVKPTLPNGGWSITVEAHYYILLPLFLWLAARHRALPLLLVAVAMLIRVLWFAQHGEVRSVGYWTIIGRVDQFALGTIAFYFRELARHKHVRAAVLLTGFLIVYWGFDLIGGYTETEKSPLWIFLPTLEGAAYAFAIAYYDTSFKPSTRGISSVLGKFGTYSYSIYLLHLFFATELAIFIDQHVMKLSNFYVALVWGIVCFIAAMPLGYVSFRFIESPFLKLRRKYVSPEQTVTNQSPPIASSINPSAADVPSWR